MSDGDLVTLALTAARKWWKETPPARPWPADVFWWPAYRRMAEVAPRLPADPVHARRILYRAGRFGCVDELRELIGRAAEHPQKLFEAGLVPFSATVHWVCRGPQNVPARGAGRPLTAPDRAVWRGYAPPVEHRLLAIWCEARRWRATMTMRDRLWLYLYGVEGWRMRDIGAVWGLGETTVAHALRRLAPVRKLAVGQTRRQRDGGAV